jgi:hypothetical protein
MGLWYPQPTLVLHPLQVDKICPNAFRDKVPELVYYFFSVIQESEHI